MVTVSVPEFDVAYQILALNIEKAHNLREKALEVSRMYAELAKLSPDRKESEFSLEFEEPQLITCLDMMETVDHLSSRSLEN